MARKPKAIKIAVYLRCSTDDQADREYRTIDDQRQKTNKFAQQCIVAANASMDLTPFLDKEAKRFAGAVSEPISEFSDAGRTGTNLERPGFKALLAAAQAGQVNVVVVTFLSRLARGGAFHAAKYLLKQAGAIVLTCAEHFTSDDAGQMNKDFNLLMTGQYARQISEWTKSKQEGMVFLGHWTCGRVPFGYTAEPVAGMSPNKKGVVPKRAVPSPMPFISSKPLKPL